MVKEAARAVSERDDRLLAEKMEALENANKEVRWCKGIDRSCTVLSDNGLLPVCEIFIIQ